MSNDFTVRLGCSPVRDGSGPTSFETIRYLKMNFGGALLTVRES